MAVGSNVDMVLQLIESRPLLGGRFSDIRRMGPTSDPGAFSLMFTAHDATTGRRAALKFFNPLLVTGGRNGYRWDCFEREARLLTRLSALPSVIRCLAPLERFAEPLGTSIGIWNLDFAYYAMELAAHSLADRLARDPGTPEERLTLFHAMCKAVQALHGERVAHRDLKPGNFLIMPDGTIRLADLGTARWLADPAGALRPDYDISPGDVTYTAPELFALLHDADPAIALRADMFSLGAILFELLAGQSLGATLYTPHFGGVLLHQARALTPERRLALFDSTIRALAAANPLPSVAHRNFPVPPIILDRVDMLYQSLAALDHRRRERAFQGVFRQIALCLRLLRRGAGRPAPPRAPVGGGRIGGNR